MFLELQLLNEVTGVRGLMARSAVRWNESHSSGGEWHNSTAMPGWVWKGDTSSDEVDGHVFAFAAIAHFLPSSSIANEAK